MNPQVAEWKNKVANATCNLSGTVTRSDFWDMDLDELDFWNEIAESKKEGIKKAQEKAEQEAKRKRR